MAIGGDPIGKLQCISCPVFLKQESGINISKSENLNYNTGKILACSRVPKIEEKPILVKRRVGFSFLGL